MKIMLKKEEDWICQKNSGHIAWWDIIYYNFGIYFSAKEQQCYSGMGRILSRTNKQNKFYAIRNRIYWWNARNKNSFIPSPRIDGSTKEDFNKDITITETKLIPGEYKKYSVLKNKDTYTIKVKGNPKFSYTLNKVAPRKYIGEDGIEYSTSLYLE